MRAPPERRPLGSDDFVTQLEDLVQRRLRRQKPGRKAKAPENSGDLFAAMDGGPAQSGNMQGVTAIP